MSELKVTPGEWFIAGKMTLYIEARIGGGLVQEIAAVGPTESDSGYGEQQQANARLIAAAPELYDMLDRIWHECSDDLSGRAGVEIEQLLAKARGSS